MRSIQRTALILSFVLIADRLNAQPPPLACPPTPVVSLKMCVAAQACPGDDLVYRITICNKSQACAHHTEVKNPLPANAQFVRANPAPIMQGTMLVWKFGTLRPCQKRTIQLILRPTGTGDVCNSARVHFAHGQCCTTRIMGGGRIPPITPPVTPPITPPVTPPITPPITPPVTPPAEPVKLEIRKNGPKRSILHRTVDYTLEVTNVGKTVAKDVQLTDLLPNDMTVVNNKPKGSKKSLLVWNLGELQPGAKRTFDYSVVTLKTGKFVNKAAVTAEGGVREEATHELIVGEVKLKMSIEGPNRRYVNRPGEYTISIVNEGDVGANNVSVSYDVPKDVKVDKISDSGLVRDNKITWMLGMVEAKTKRMVTFRLQASKAGEVTHKAVLTSDEQSELRAASRTVFKGVAGLALSIKDIVDPLDVKQEGSYEIVVRNTGTANANEVQIKAIVPKELRITDQKGPSKSKVQGGTVVFEPITLQPKKEVKFIVYVTAQKPGDVRFRVEMTAKELTSGPVAEEESTTIATP